MRDVDRARPPSRRGTPWSALAAVAVLLSALMVPLACLPTRSDPQFCDRTVEHACPQGMVCNVIESTCYPFGTDLSVGGDAPVPPETDMAVQGCTDSVQCPANQPVCKSRQCSACSAAGDGGTSAECQTNHPTTPFCGPRGNCVECLSKDDCASQQKACDPNLNLCGACVKHADCATGVCEMGGACARQADVYYVDNHGMAMGCKSGDGKSPAASLCDIMEAMGAMPARKYIAVAGSAQPYGAISASKMAASFTIVAAARLKAAIFGTITVPAVSVTAGSLALDGFDIEVPQGMTPPDAVDCSGINSTLIIRNSSVSASKKVGIHSTDCTILLDSDLITGNTRGGVNIDGMDTYSITNCYVVDNGGGGAGVQLGAAALGMFAFNTVANNGIGAGTFGGIACNGIKQQVESSIVVKNEQFNGSQLSGLCQLVDVVTGPDSAKGANMGAPKLLTCASPLAMMIKYCLAPDSMIGVDLVPKNVTAADGGTRTLVDHDYFGATRPQGPGYDVGAQEAQ